MTEMRHASSAARAVLVGKVQPRSDASGHLPLPVVASRQNFELAPRVFFWRLGVTSGLEQFGSAATTGLKVLDDALEGLYWGDSVVWELEEDVSVEPFYRAIADSAAGYHFAAYVTLTTDPRQLQALYPHLVTI